MNGNILEMRLRVPLGQFDLNVAHASQERVIGLFGASGAGKTTLLESLAGLRRTTSGYLRFRDEVWLDSDSGSNLLPEQRGVGYVPQEHLLFPHRDVRGNLLAGKGRAVRGGVDFAAAFEEVVRVLELKPLLERSVNDLSGGEGQRVALGRALCSGPRLLLLDEPLASLDTPLRHRILPYLIRVKESFSLPIFIASHNPLELQALCDEIMILREGSILAVGSPFEVLTRPEVFSAAAAEGFENILPAVVGQHRAHTSSVALGSADSALLLTVPRARRPVGARVHLGIRAHDVMLATEPPVGLSARNCLPAVIRSIEAVEHIHLVTAVLREDLPPVIAELTRDAVTELNLEPGKAVFLVTKTHSIALYE